MALTLLPTNVGFWHLADVQPIAVARSGSGRKTDVPSVRIVSASDPKRTLSVSAASSWLNIGTIN